jgi:hypothetical protein
MPGYLSARVISFTPAEKAATEAALAVIQGNIVSINNTIESIQGDIDDLSLNLGV